MAELVRVAALSGFFPTMQALGVDPAPLLKEAGLTPRMFGNTEQMIPARPAIRLLERAAEVTKCATFGLRMAESRSIANLGATSLLIAHQPTLRAALEVMVQFRNRLNSTLILGIEEFGEIAILSETLAIPGSAASRQAHDLALAVLARACAVILGDRWRPDQVCFNYGRKAAGDIETYRRVFGCPVIFDAEFSGIVIAKSDLDGGNPRADAALALHARALLDAVFDDQGRTVAQEVEEAITILLPAGRGSIEACADALGLNVRTLQRQLVAAGTSYSAILGRVRSRLLERYLNHPRLRLTDIADMLGYASLGAFTHWHIQTFGMTPSQARKQARSKRTRVA